MSMTPKTPARERKRIKMKVHDGIEKDLLKEVKEAKPEDCKKIIDALNNLEGETDLNGELTTLGILKAVIIEELLINGIIKRKLLNIKEG